MSRLQKHVRDLTARLWTAAHARAADVATASAVAHQSTTSLACPVSIQSRSLHLWTRAALPTASSVHVSAARERQYASSSSSAFDFPPEAKAARQQQQQALSNSYSTSSAAAPSGHSYRSAGQRSMSPSHKGGPAPEVAAKEHWPSQYRDMGRIKGPYKLPRKQVFAVVELGATQYKVAYRLMKDLASVPAPLKPWPQ